ncbi:MAG TPA: molybdopterin molybdotransferase MoeA, partial [Candidatus Eisenbacteria bacterium]|nr:molybdopterin molybdotransferase MoeA [Candidatus Eisenbacteria bacterium]
GADLAAGELALEEGRELSAYDLALLAALGVAEVPVARAPRVAVLSTGDELLDPDQPLVAGAIRDSNLPMLALLAEQAGAQVVVAERLPDDPERVAVRIGEALEVADVVLTIGGVSAGDFDPVKLALARVGGVETWRVAMRPGRPQASGAPAGRLFHGLPGNPASVACVFETLVRPALRRMQGHARLDRPRLAVRAARAVESRPGRTDFVRCTLEWRDGAAWAAPAGAQVSGHLTPQSRAHALVVVPEAAPGLAAGEAAEALVLRLPER